MLQVLPATSPVIAPVDGFILDPSPGFGLKLNVPPGVLITPGAPPLPAQKSAQTNVGSSPAVIDTVTVAVALAHGAVPVTVQVYTPATFVAGSKVPKSPLASAEGPVHDPPASAPPNSGSKLAGGAVAHIL